jgi:hypothetical protein
MKLNPNELRVTSFDTTADTAASTDTLLIPTTDPTDATRCYVCPMETYRCY